MAEVGSAAAVALLKKMAYPRTNRGRIRSLLGSINNLTHKEYAMKKCTVGIDAHKASNVLALTFEDMKAPVIFGKVSADLNKTVDSIRKIQNTKIETGDF